MVSGERAIGQRGVHPAGCPHAGDHGSCKRKRSSTPRAAHHPKPARAARDAAGAPNVVFPTGTVSVGKPLNRLPPIRIDVDQRVAIRIQILIRRNRPHDIGAGGINAAESSQPRPDLALTVRLPDVVSCVATVWGLTCGKILPAIDSTLSYIKDSRLWSIAACVWLTACRSS
jgi:hypothetical protein